MRFRLIGFALAAGIGLAGAIGLYANWLRPDHAPPAPSSHLDRIIVLVLESYRSDEVDPASIASNPFLTKLAAQSRVALNYYGVWKPSLPNYVAMIGGDVFGIRDNLGSCFNPDHPTKCNSVDAPNLVDQLERANIAWEGLFEFMPRVGSSGEKFPEGATRYAQKHNPFVYFKSVALDPARLAKLKPFVPGELHAELADPLTAAKFIYIVPNLCDDEHGSAAVGPTPSRSRQETHFLQRRYPQSLMPLLSQIDRFFSSRGTIRLVTELAVEIGGGVAASRSSLSPSMRWA